MDCSSSAPQTKPAKAMVVAAFAAIYLIWGSTYLGIRIALETMPPFFLGAGRFLLAGSGLYAWIRWKGGEGPNWMHWRNALVIGALLLGLGNGGVNWAEQKVDSSVVALIIAVTPLWFALIDWVRPGGQRPQIQTMLGILIGFIGMVLLIAPTKSHESTGLPPTRIAGVIIASIAWASGSLYSRYTPKPSDPLLAVALQMIAGGMVLALMGIVNGESDLFSVSRISIRSGTAFTYLTVIGSLVGFTAYSWLLKVSTPALVSTYAYVNPVIAVFLGWAFAGEKLTARSVSAAVVIICGVIIISTRRPKTVELEPGQVD